MKIMHLELIKISAEFGIVVFPLFLSNQASAQRLLNNKFFPFPQITLISVFSYNSAFLGLNLSLQAGRLCLKDLIPPNAARRFQKKHYFGGDLQCLEKIPEISRKKTALRITGRQRLQAGEARSAMAFPSGNS